MAGPEGGRGWDPGTGSFNAGAAGGTLTGQEWLLEARGPDAMRHRRLGNDDGMDSQPQRGTCTTVVGACRAFAGVWKKAVRIQRRACSQ